MAPSYVPGQRAHREAIRRANAHGKEIVKRRAAQQRDEFIGATKGTIHQPGMAGHREVLERALAAAEENRRLQTPEDAAYIARLFARLRWYSRTT
jgi:hypothetical protein